MSDNPDLEQAERPRGSCLICGWDRPFRVWLSGGEVGACDECYEARDKLRDQKAYVRALEHDLNAAGEQLAEREREKARAVFIAQHLFQMVSKEVWREQGADYMGQYEGDHWAEQTRLELEALAAPDPDKEQRSCQQ